MIITDESQNGESSFKGIEIVLHACLYRLTECACRPGIRCIKKDTSPEFYGHASMKDSAQRYFSCRISHSMITGYYVQNFEVVIFYA